MGDRRIGGVLGVYRRSKLQHPVDWVGLLVVELITTALLLILTLPMGLGMLRWVPSYRVMGITMGVATLAGVVALQGWRWWKGRSLQTLLHLLDEIDRYHEVLAAVMVIDQLAAAQGTTPSDPFETLQLTRDCLITGLKTERLLREKNSLLIQDKVVHLEQSLALLQTLELQFQAQEYATILQHTLTIAERVQQELRLPH